MASPLDDLIHRADLNELVRHVDATCSSRDWDHLVRIRDSARSAVSTGRQLWPIATLANYRLALWAPPEHAVRALDDTARTFMPGPVSEIIAVHHRWSDLEEHLARGHDRSLIAYERALRGDEIEQNEDPILEIPIEPQPWEPSYELATYTDDGVDFPAPDLPRPIEFQEAEEAVIIDDPDTVGAFRRLVEPWTAHSNGQATAVVAEGTISEALGALGLQQARVAPLTAQEGLSFLAWAGASGGAYGKRRGVAGGRSEAWWFLASFTGMLDDWPCEPQEFGEIVTSLQFSTFDDGLDNAGWSIRLMIEDPQEGLVVAVRATDSAD